MPIDVKQSWKGFVSGLRSLFNDLSEHRHQDQFLAARQAALRLAESDDMAEAMQLAYDSPNATDKRPADVVVSELDAFPLAISVHQAEVKSGSAKAGASKLLLSAAAIILGSVSDVFSLTTYGKGVVTVLKEAVELFSPE